MQAIILAAGKGTRLQPLTLNTPKAMIPVNGKPMLEMIINQLKTIKVTHVTIVTGYLKEKIKDYFKDGSRLGTQINYTEQKELNGSARAVLTAEKYITDDKFICIACDSLFETSLLERLASHKSDGVFACKEVEDGRRYGILVTEGRRVTKVIEKPDNPPTNLANFSTYLLPRAIFTACRQVKPGKNGEYWITDAIQLLIDSGMTFEYEKSQHLLDIGTPEQLEEAQEFARKLGI